MDQALIIKKNSESGLIDFLTFLLKNDKVSGVFTLRKTKKPGDIEYAFITDPKLLQDAVPLHPFLPVNAGKVLSEIGDLEKPAVAIIKPCELRSFIELVKRSQGKLENFLLVSYTCGGAFTFKTAIDDKKSPKLLPDYWKAVATGKDFDDIREMCKACDFFIPLNADITVSLWGTNTDTCRMFLHTEKAKSMAEGFNDGQVKEEELDRSTLDKTVKKRKEFKEKLFNQINIQDTGLDGLIDVFGKCIGCHACSRVCPICYCVLCDFESATYDYDSDVMTSELTRKGGLRLPPDTVLYQIGRLSHMSFSCIGCGQCTEVCPVDIPVSVIFRKNGEKVAEIFDYIPGRDVEEQVPVTIFKEEEFTEIGED